MKFILSAISIGLVCATGLGGYGGGAAGGYGNDLGYASLALESSSAGSIGGYNTYGSGGKHGIGLQGPPPLGGLGRGGKHGKKQFVQPVAEEVEIEQFVSDDGPLVEKQVNAYQTKQKYAITHKPVYHKTVYNYYTATDTINKDVIHHKYDSEQRYYDVAGKQIYGGEVHVGAQKAHVATGKHGKHGKRGGGGGKHGRGGGGGGVFSSPPVIGSPFGGASYGGYGGYDGGYGGGYGGSAVGGEYATTTTTFPSFQGPDLSTLQAPFQGNNFQTNAPFQNAPFEGLPNIGGQGAPLAGGFPITDTGASYSALGQTSSSVQGYNSFNTDQSQGFNSFNTDQSQGFNTYNTANAYQQPASAGYQSVSSGYQSVPSGYQSTYTGL